MHHLDWLHNNLHRVPALKKLSFPNRISGSSLLSRYDLSPLVDLQVFTWRPQSRPAIGEVSLVGNHALTELVLQFHGDALLFNLPNHLSVRLTLPQAPLQKLELETLFILPDRANLFRHALWQHSLTTLRVGAVIFDDVLDLTGFHKLEELYLADAQLDLDRLRLPTGAPLRRLGLRGRQMPALLQQLGVLPWPHLTHLEICVDPLTGHPMGVPWHAMPKLTSLVLVCSTPQPLDLGQLGVPVNNRIHTLALRHRIHSLRPDRTLKEQPMPLLRHLDLCRYRLTKARIAELASALAREGIWPRLETLSIMPSGMRKNLRQELIRLGRRHKFVVVPQWTAES